MAIGNVTPDSFYAGSRLMTEESVVSWAERSLSAGADILDIGACSTRPGSSPVCEEEEWHRLEPSLRALRRTFPEASLSLDTFRPSIARRAVEQFGPMIINDISGGSETMWSLVRALRVPYVWTIKGQTGLPARMPLQEDMDIILDPGFGFLGGPEADYDCMRRLDELCVYGLPVLVGVSRKSMVYKPLNLTPETCLTATQALQMFALEHGTTILRTHDVAETKQTITLFNLIKGNMTYNTQNG